jgi:SAM-dependent methyltransferase
MISNRVSRHYLAATGARYFDWQSQGGEIGAVLEARKFASHVRSSDRVVDFGCGSGGVLAKLDARDKLGIEVNEAARVFAASLGIKTVTSAEELPAHTADVVISNHALEHALSPLHELRALHRILRTGGKLVLWLPIDDWRAQKISSEEVDRNHHLFTWTPVLLRNLLAEAGFEVVHCKVVAYAWPPKHESLFRILPGRIFDGVAFLTSALLKRRQLMALAVKA